MRLDESFYAFHVAVLYTPNHILPKMFDKSFVFVDTVGKIHEP